jgi:hypothetical protein
LLTRLNIFLFFLFVSTQFVFSQNSKIVYPHTVFWSKTEVNQIFENGLGLGMDFVYRRKDNMNSGNMFKHPLRESIRPWVHYQFSPYARFSFSPLGYMHTNEYIAKPEDYLRNPYHELRTTFQFFHHTKQMGGRIMHTWRYRHELRWQERSGLDDYRFLQRFRLRYRVRYIFNSNDFYENNIVYTAVSNEIGLNFGKNVIYNIFNQNRLYVGVGYRFLNAARVELRYVNRYRTRGATGYEFDNGQGIMIGIYIDQLTGLGKKTIQDVRFAD